MPLTSNNNESHPFLYQKRNRIMCCVHAHNLCGEPVFGVTSPHLKFRTSDFIQHRGKFSKAWERTGGCVLKRIMLDLPQMEHLHFRLENFAIFQTWDYPWSFASFSALLEQMARAYACPQNETLMPDTCTPTVSFSFLGYLLAPLQ